MDRTVIVLSPMEWEDRKTLSKTLSDAYQQLHYAKTNDAIMDALILLLSLTPKNEKLNIEEVNEIVEQLTIIRTEVFAHIGKAQEIIGSISTTIEYKEREGTVS